MYADARDINLDFQALICPKIVNFENGCLKNGSDTAKKMKFDTYKPKSVDDPMNTKSLMTAESKNMKYIGKRKEQPCKYYLGVFDSETQQIDIHHSQIFTLHPSLIDENNRLSTKGKTDDAEKPFMQQNDKLVEAFGSSKQKRALSARKKNLVDKDEQNTKMFQVANNIVSSESATNLQESCKDSLTPPINMEAKTAASLYNIEHIISSNDNNVLLKEVPEFIHVDADKIKQWQNENKYPEYILCHLSQLPISADARLQKSTKLLYLAYLIRFFKLTYNELRKKDILSDMPPEIRNKLLSNFSLEKDKKRFLPKRLKDKILCYILVLALMIDEFVLDCTLLMKDLKLGPARLSSHLKAIGCIVETRKFKKGSELDSPNTTSKTMATLKVPLPNNFTN